CDRRPVARDLLPGEEAAAGGSNPHGHARLFKLCRQKARGPVLFATGLGMSVQVPPHRAPALGVRLDVSIDRLPPVVHRPSLRRALFESRCDQSYAEWTQVTMIRDRESPSLPTQFARAARASLW